MSNQGIENNGVGVKLGMHGVPDLGSACHHQATD